MITFAQFQAAFPELQSANEAAFDFWSGQAYSQLNNYRLGTQIDYAAMLFTAHNLALSAIAARQAAAGGQVGLPATILTSKAVGGVSASYDVQATAIEGAGQWNATVYGQRLYPLLRGASLGGLMVGPPCPPTYAPGFSPWRGVY